MGKKVIIVQKNSDSLQKMSFLFENQGLTIEAVPCGREQETDLQEADLILVELAPKKGKISAFEDVLLMKRMRGMTDKPIMVFGEKLDEITIIALLNAGADDCVTDACAPLELVARVNAQIRRYIRLRGSLQSYDVLKIGDLEINDTAKTVLVEGRSVSMTPMEYKILHLLAKKRGKVLSTKQIYEEVWHMKPIGADNTVAVHVRHIREKIESNPQQPKYLQVVWGQGYKVG